MSLTGGGDGILGFTILPVYAGAVNTLGEEPISDPSYRRAMIKWDVMPNGERVGRAAIDVPPGNWNWVIYCYHPTLPSFYSVVKLPVPVTTSAAGVVSLDCITIEDLMPNAHPLGVLPD